MTITNLDVTALFPFPGELATRPTDAVRASASSDTIGGPSGEPSSAQTSVESNAPGSKTLAEHLQQLNVELQSFGIEFELSDVDNRLITRVVDRETGELIRQIPSEEVLRIARSLTETTGLLLHTTA